MLRRIAPILSALLIAILVPFPGLPKLQAAPAPPPKKPTSIRRGPSPAPASPAPSRPETTPRPASSSSGLASQAGPSAADKARLAMIRARRVAVEKEIERLKTQAESALKDLDSIDLDLRLAAHRFDEAELEFKQTARLLDATIKDVQTTRERIERTRPRVIKSLAALNKLGELSYARLLFSLDDPADVLRGYRYVSRIASADGDQIRIFRASLVELGVLEDQLKKRTVQNVENRRRLGEARRALSSRKSIKEARLEEITRERRLQERVAGEYGQREAELLRLLGESGEGAKSGAPVQTIPPFPGEIPLRSRKGVLAWPVVGTVVKMYGVERDPKFGTRTIQQGIEIDAFPEIEVHAVHAGRVVFADLFVGYGMLVIIDHGNREHTLYARLGELMVAPGDDVAEGSLLGLLPNTRVTGSGLHFEVREQGKPEDPLEWLKRP